MKKNIQNCNVRWHPYHNILAIVEDTIGKDQKEEQISLITL